MSLQVEKLEKNMAKLTIEVPAEEFDAAIKNAYNKNKNKFSIPGFRKGKAPLAMLEKMYGAGIFYEDAANEVIDASYPKAAEESKEEIVSTPEIKVTQIEKGKAFIYEATVALKPEVTLGEYKGVEVKKAEAVVTDEDVENELTAARKKNGRLIDVDDLFLAADLHAAAVDDRIGRVEQAVGALIGGRHAGHVVDPGVGQHVALVDLGGVTHKAEHVVVLAGDEGHVQALMLEFVNDLFQFVLRGAFLGGDDHESLFLSCF